MNGKTAVDFISWDSLESFDSISYDEVVLIENAKVSNYQGTTQLEIKAGLSKVREPEQSVL